MKRRTSLSLPYPPTVNTYWRHVVMGRCPPTARVLISKRGRAYREHVVASCREQGVETLTGALRVGIGVFLPDRRRRDLDNVLKSLLDALEHAGVYKDDSQIVRLELWRAGLVKDGRVEVTVEEIG